MQGAVVPHHQAAAGLCHLLLGRSATVRGMVRAGFGYYTNQVLW